MTRLSVHPLTLQTHHILINLNIDDIKLDDELEELEKKEKEDDGNPQPLERKGKVYSILFLELILLMAEAGTRRVYLCVFLCRKDLTAGSACDEALLRHNLVSRLMRLRNYFKNC